MSKLFILCSLVCFIFFSSLLWQRAQPIKAANISKPSNNTQIKSPTTAAFVFISSVNIRLPITESKIINNQWQTVNNGVSHWNKSPVPGEVGNSILYGHNWPNLLGPIKNIAPGDQIEVGFTNGEKTYFTVNKTETVEPNDLSILQQTNDRRLTIYTCTGLLDSKRFIVVAVRD